MSCARVSIVCKAREANARHVTGDVLDEGSSVLVAEDLAPELCAGKVHLLSKLKELAHRTGLVEVLGTDLGEEDDGLGRKLAVNGVKVDASVGELNRID